MVNGGSSLILDSRLEMYYQLAHRGGPLWRKQIPLQMCLAVLAVAAHWHEYTPPQMNTVFMRTILIHAVMIARPREGKKQLADAFQSFQRFFFPPLLFCGREKYRGGSRRRLLCEYKFTFSCICLMRSGRKGS